MQVPYIGVIPAASECVVPPGAKIVELKHCETCGFLFTRKNRDRNCRSCHSNPKPLSREIEFEILEDLMREEHPLPQ